MPAQQPNAPLAYLASLSPIYVEPELPAAEQDAAAAYADAARSPATLRGYAADCRAFAAWCEARGVRPMPASGKALAGYVAHMAEHGGRDGRGARPASIDRALSAISQRHEAAGLPSPRTDPLVRAARKGIRRTVGTAPEQKTPLRAPDLRAALAALPAGAIGTRDRALLLVGWGAAMRRAELVGLDVSDVRVDR
jgi:site-specific recombinase XerD